MILSKECHERGCAAYDDRVDEGVAVEKKWVGLTMDETWALYCEAKEQPIDGWWWYAQAIEEALYKKLYGEKNT